MYTKIENGAQSEGPSLNEVEVGLTFHHLW